MGLNVNSSYYGSAANISSIDSQALTRVKEQILNPNNDGTIDVSKLNLSKFNRVSLGTDLYAERTSTNTALQASKAATDFDVNLSREFDSNVQYLNAQAAQSLFSVKENTPTAISIDVTNQTINEQEAAVLTSQTSETQDLNKDRRGSNPFSFYMPSEESGETDDNDSSVSSINIFA